MSSHTHSTDKAQQLQDEWIKTDRNFFLTWDHWVPPQVGPTISIQQENLPVGFKYLIHKQNNRAKPPASSTIPVNKAHAATTADNHCGEEEHISSQADQYDMCWDD
jgi:hypothetical protein